MRDRLQHHVRRNTYWWLSLLAIVMFVMAAREVVAIFSGDPFFPLPKTLLFFAYSFCAFFLWDMKKEMEEADMALRHRLTRTDKKLRDCAETIIRNGHSCKNTDDHIS